jgi:hypothetical protein
MDVFVEWLRFYRNRNHVSTLAPQVRANPDPTLGRILTSINRPGSVQSGKILPASRQLPVRLRPFESISAVDEPPRDPR